jgi:hypothetical protein
MDKPIAYRNSKIVQFPQSLSAINKKDIKTVPLSDLLKRCDTSSVEEIINICTRREDFAIEIYNNSLIMKRIKDRELSELLIKILKFYREYREK